MTDNTEALPPIERDEHMDRTYIPLPGGWEVQTKGKGSTFRLCDTKRGDRWPVLDEHLHEALERMAREVRAALAQRQQVPALSEDEVRRLWDKACRTVTVQGGGNDVLVFAEYLQRALTAAPSAQADPVAWRITTVGGRTFFEDKPPLSCYTQEWLNRCQEVTPLYAAPPAAQAEPRVPREEDRARTAMERYNELLMAVCNKYPGETRHETALRYIRRAEQQADGIGKQED